MKQCPADDILRDFIRGGLDRAERKHLIEHISQCDRCRGDYFVNSTNEPRRASRGRSRFARWAITAATLLAVVIVSRQLYKSTLAPVTGMAALVEATADLPYRTVTGRLSGDFEYKPLSEATRPAEASLLVRFRSVTAARAGAGPLNGHVTGIAHLLMRNYDAAVRDLEDYICAITAKRDVLEAVNALDTADVLNDLAVAYLERARVEDDPRDQLSAIECMERAWTLRQSPAMAWNRALALERAGFRDRAAAAWHAYLELEARSGWSAEAAAHVGALPAPSRTVLSRSELLSAIREATRKWDATRLRTLADDDPEQFRLIGEEMLLPDAAAALPSRGDAWNAVRQVADVLAARDEQLLGDAVGALERADASSLAIAAQALQAWRRGREFRKPAEYAEAFSSLSEAATGLAKARNPFAVRAEVFRATIRMYDRHARDAVGLIDRALAANPEIERWPLAAAQLYWVRGLALHNDGDPGGALRSYEIANRYLPRISESGARAGIAQVYADALRDIGNPLEAWRYLLSAVSVLNATTPYARKLNVLNGVIQESLNENYRSLPASIRSDVLRLAKSAGDTLYLCSTLLVAAKAATRTGDFASADAFLHEAEAELQSLGDAAMALRVRADIDIARFRLIAARGQNPDVALVTRSLSLVESIHDHTRIGEVRLLRANAHLRHGDRESAREDLRAGLQEMESQRQTLLEDERRAQAAVVAELLDVWMELEFDAGNEERAFDLAEQARARLLIERTSFGNEPRRPLRWSEIRGRLPDNVVLIVFSVLANRLIVWRATHDRLSATSAPIDHYTFRLRLKEFTESVANDVSVPSSKELYDVLCGQLLKGLADAHVIFVPDSEMFDIPFSALRNPRSGEYAIARNAISIQPSATLAVMPRSDDRLSPDGRSLVVGVGSSPGSPMLPAVRAEAKAVASRLKNAIVLTDGEVTADSFERHAVASEVIHFAGHAIANAKRPERSALVLGSTSADGNVLTAARISTMDLRRTKLVVLGACKTAEGKSAAEVPMTLATAFIAAGASMVVASSTDADDAASHRLFELLYTNLGEGISPVESLRAAQLELSHDSRFAAPRYWAPFTLIGAPAMGRAH